MRVVRLSLTLILGSCLTAIFVFPVCGEQMSANNAPVDTKIEMAQKALSCTSDSLVTCRQPNCPNCSPKTPKLGGHRPYHAGPCIDGKCEEGTCKICDQCKQRVVCHDGPCVEGLCENGTCKNCDGSCTKSCPVHGKNCEFNCLQYQYGYGAAQICPGKINGVCPIHGYGVCPHPLCPGKINGVCPIHGYGNCPHPRQIMGSFLRQVLQPVDRPYFGAQPLYVPREQYDHNFQPYFPRFRALLLTRPVPDPAYTTVAPPAPMPTYTTRGPRDFLNPNPPNIGY